MAHRAILGWFLLLATVGAQDANASGGRLLPEQAAIDVRHYDLALTVDPQAKTISGACTMTARALTSVERVALHLDQRLTVSSVVVGERQVPFTHADGLVRVTLPGPVAEGGEVAVTIAYGGAPRVAPNPPWKGGFTWKETRDGQPWIATSCQGEGADLWWPCKDHPSDKPETFDLHITVPRGLVCASNGTLRKVERVKGGRRFHWHVANPISNYCVALNIAPYTVLKTTFVSVDGTRVPVEFYALPRNEAKAKKFLPEVLDHLKQMEEICGPYPFRNEKYGVAETPHLGMEHQTIIAYGNKYRVRQAFNYDWLHHHEMSHEWWGNLVTCKDWRDMWIHEGIGTYMQALYLESRRGPEAYAVQMTKKRRTLRNSRPIAPRASQDSKQIYFNPKGGFDNDLYDKGSWVMHTLRWVLGDKQFFKALRRMAYPDPKLEKVTDGSQGRFATTEGLRAIAEEHHGEDLRWFFDLYVRQPALPELVVKKDGGRLQLAWKTPGDVEFPMPVPVKLGKKIVRVPMPGGKATVALKGRVYEVDPNHRLLKVEPRRPGRRGRRR
ncbi:MAG: peptidase M1 [Planctomycetes bacterium]|nr:peptidase M1 [Planctomycetota bacterium]